MARKGRALLVVASMLLLMMVVSACGEPQEPAANQINQLVLGDQQINESLKEIARHEREDLELYATILQKGKNKNSNLEALLDQAQDHVDQRRELLDQAMAVMEQTKQQLDGLRESIGELSFEKEETLAQAQAVLERYETRAGTFEEYVAAYQQSLDADQQLYDMMRKKAEPNLVKIKRAIRLRNSEYGKLAELREQFNQQTKAFNNANAKLVNMEQPS
ncbi:MULTISPECIES: YkyA family protein [Paenibacillus]|uniref:YkyA family protein n=1 Tax=Paenibacillus TaxID=44249 RepID=UPI001F275C23|nr:YkyA family protein [Paenibacillus sp. JJ-223]CAH1225523.1 hypothetical protein PAECIP111890_05813 [Paenibacillus sp. JJ-223]